MRTRFLLALFYTAVLVTLAVLLRVPLGHDEAVYALGGDFSPMQIHRSIGMQVLAAPGVLAGGELGFRLTAIACTLGFVAAAWLYARCAFGAAVATWTAIVVATSFAVLHGSSELLPDAPAAAVLLTFSALLVDGLTAGQAPRWRLVATGPLAATAFYLRYGSSVVVAALVVAAAIAFRRRLWAQRGPLAIALVLGAGLLVPHVLHSMHVTGSPLGILRAGRAMAGRPGAGLVFYATSWWLWLGPAAAVCTAGGLFALATRKFTEPREREVATFAGLAAGLALIGLGAIAHGEARFAFVPEVLLGATGIAALRGVRRNVAVAVVLISALGCFAATAWTLAGAKRTFAVTVAAGAAIRDEAAGRPCTVVTTQWAQLAWYSGCRPIDGEDWITQKVVAGETYVVWFERGHRQWQQVLEAALRGENGVRAIELRQIPGDGDWGGATIYRLPRVP